MTYGNHDTISNIKKIFLNITMSLQINVSII